MRVLTPLLSYSPRDAPSGFFSTAFFEHPHTACSCFKGMAFYIKEVDGIGLMDRSFRGAASYGWGWDDVANAAVGMQSSEFAPFGTDYLKSGKFL